MAQSSGRFEPGLEGRPGLNDGPEHIHAPACACDDGLVVSFSFSSLAVDQHGAVGVDGCDPVYLLGNVDPDADPHGTPWRLKVRHPAHAVFARHSDQSQSLISGRGAVAVSGELPPEPSWAASMKTIPTPPPRRDPGMSGSRRQALLAQHLNGSAA